MRISDWSSDVFSSDLVEMLWSDEDQWSAAATCDAAVICGNPRFSVSPDDAWWECGIWSRINELSRSGVRVIDGWAGATAELDCDNAVEKLIEHPRVQDALSFARCLWGRIEGVRNAEERSRERRVGEGGGGKG